VLFNNAGIMHAKDDDAVTTDESVWDLTLEVNAKGVFLGCKYGIPALRHAGGGSVINTASFVARMGAATPQIAYTASKGGVLALTHALAVSLGPQVRVNCVSPGWIDTGRSKLRRVDHEQHPAGRVGRTDDIAEMVAFLLSEKSGFTTGANFVVDGGMTRKMIYEE